MPAPMPHLGPLAEQQAVMKDGRHKTAQLPKRAPSRNPRARGGSFEVWTILLGFIEANDNDSIWKAGIWGWGQIGAR